MSLVDLRLTDDVSVFDTLWDEQYKNYEGYRSRMLEKTNVNEHKKGNNSYWRAKKLGNIFKAQKMSDIKRKIQQWGTNARIANKHVNNYRQNLYPI